MLGNKGTEFAASEHLHLDEAARW